MKKILLTIAIVAAAISCKQSTEPSKEVTIPEVPSKEYPASVASVFEAHGGIDTWNALNTLKYTIKDEQVGDQTHTVDLKSRKIRHDAPKYTLGFDGDKVWLQQDSTYFNPERARFSHNLMFYFYAMPFVLGDDGITYTEVDPIKLDGVEYPGTKISFGADVGDAPDDNYILYRDANTNQMVWLAYTVTYGKDGPSDKYSYIKYSDWKNINGVMLPSQLNWHPVKDGVVGESRFERTFASVSADIKAPEASLFQKPDSGTFVE